MNESVDLALTMLGSFIRKGNVTKYNITVIKQNTIRGDYPPHQLQYRIFKLQKKKFINQKASLNMKHVKLFLILVVLLVANNHVNAEFAIVKGTCRSG